MVDGRDHSYEDQPFRPVTFEFTWGGTHGYAELLEVKPGEAGVRVRLETLFQEPKLVPALLVKVMAELSNRQSESPARSHIHLGELLAVRIEPK